MASVFRSVAAAIMQHHRGGLLVPSLAVRRAATAEGLRRAAVSGNATDCSSDMNLKHEPLIEGGVKTKLSKLACPNCCHPVIAASDPSVSSRFASILECCTCKKVYHNKENYWDLTRAVGSTVYSESMTH